MPPPKKPQKRQDPVERGLLAAITQRQMERWAEVIPSIAAELKRTTADNLQDLRRKNERKRNEQFCPHHQGM
jgi:hypothetical protein